MKANDVKTSACIGFDVENNDKDPKFKVGYHARISKYKNTFQKATLQIGQKNYLLLKKLKNTILWTCLIKGLDGKKKV